MDNNNRSVQLVWGIAILVVGLMMFLNIPAKMNQISNQLQGLSSSKLNLIRFSFYMISTILIGGGTKKLYKNINYKKTDDGNS
ncbi:MAG: hypothetical protein HN931_05250 [Desulfobacterales bacterium]|jgi:hypothetical protein|nr:hypothetical protein [Desulfobacteraceae bacterium]MBT7085560.1 hypothetical protein [Desulfobacterales bacterium]